MYFLLDHEAADGKVIITACDRYAPFDDDPDGEYSDDVDYEKLFMDWVQDKVVYRMNNESAESIPAGLAIEVNWVPDDICAEGFIATEDDTIDDIMIMSPSDTSGWTRFWALLPAVEV